jgi:hypothetical protein
MYLAPLNYDRFFKKVFSSKKIAKRFLEDFLNVKIEKIEIANTSYKVTDAAVAVIFDYRCKINGRYIIIDMQQWYKSDVIKRFYVYHSLNTAFQLEDLPSKSIKISENKQYETKNYDGLIPVYTLIWMADDNLKFKEDYIAFALYPEQSVDFIKNEALWEEKDLNKILKEREKTLNLLDNNTKGLDFLPENRLIYIFQKNIVKNKKFSKYFKWFDIAEKSRNEDNTKEDFAIYENDKTLMAVIQRLRQDRLRVEKFTPIKDYEKFLIQNKIHEDIVRRDLRIEVKEELRDEVKAEVKEELKDVVRSEVKEEVRSEVKEEVRSEVKEEVRSEVKEEVRSEVKEEVRSEVKEEVRSEVKEEIEHSFIINAYLEGANYTFIATITKTPVNEVENIIENYLSEKEKSK